MLFPFLDDSIPDKALVFEETLFPLQGKLSRTRKIDAQDVFDPSRTGTENDDSICQIDSLADLMGNEQGGFIPIIEKILFPIVDNASSLPIVDKGTLFLIERVTTERTEQVDVFVPEIIPVSVELAATLRASHPENPGHSGFPPVLLHNERTSENVGLFR